MDAKSIWTAPHPQGGWGNRREGSNRWFSRAHRKDVAERIGRSTAKAEGAEHIITRRDGSVAERLRYAEDGRLMH